jgi:DNA-binding NarL/FixJ family response regulator
MSGGTAGIVASFGVPRHCSYFPYLSAFFRPLPSRQSADDIISPTATRGNINCAVFRAWPERNTMMKGTISAVMSRPHNFKQAGVLPSLKKRPESLTNREQEILELIWSGLKNREIGQQLSISVKTVEAHRANMMKKVRVSNTAQLLKAAIQDGLLKIR